VTAREVLDGIKGRGRYMASSTREERAQFRADYACLTAAVDAVLGLLEQAEEDRRVIQDNKPTARVADAMVEVGDVQDAIENALTKESQ